MTDTSTTASINHAPSIGFKQFITYLSEYANTWIPERRDAILASAIHYQDAGLRVALRNWSVFKDEYNKMADRANIEFADRMSRAMDEPTAERQEMACKDALSEYQRVMDLAEYTRRRVESYKQVLDDLIYLSSPIVK